jgi:hypothetical protein
LNVPRLGLGFGEMGKVPALGSTFNSGVATRFVLEWEEVKQMGDGDPSIQAGPGRID